MKGRIGEHFAGRDRPVAWRTPAETAALISAGGVVVDVRTAADRRLQGEIPGALVMERQLVGWRLHPSSPCRHPWVQGHDQAMVVVACDGDDVVEVVAGLAELGLTQVAGLRGGFEAWSAAGLPVCRYLHAS